MLNFVHLRRFLLTWVDDTFTLEWSCWYSSLPTPPIPLVPFGIHFQNLRRGSESTICDCRKWWYVGANTFLFYRTTLIQDLWIPQSHCFDLMDRTVCPEKIVKIGAISIYFDYILWPLRRATLIDFLLRTCVKWCHLSTRSESISPINHFGRVCSEKIWGTSIYFDEIFGPCDGQYW